MLNIIWDTRGYFFWLLVVSLFCWILERLFPWRKSQKTLRDQIWQDTFWLVFNGHYAGLLLAYLGVFLIGKIETTLNWGSISSLEEYNLVSGMPFWIQFIIFLIFKDFWDYLIHNALHRIPLFWQFHKLHHSISELDWIGNFRFHWMEIAIYRSLSYFPLIVLGVDGQVILWVAVFGTLIGHLNHSNLRIDWGIFRYVVNSPRFHVWHHDMIGHGTFGKNFGVIFSAWDWIFGTAYYPKDVEQPDTLGFYDMDKFPKGLIRRFIYPFWKAKP